MGHRHQQIHKFNLPSHSLGSARGAAAAKAHSTAEIAAINWNFIVVRSLGKRTKSSEGEGEANPITKRQTTTCVERVESSR